MASADLRPEQATDDRGGGQTAATGIMSWLTWLPRLVALHLAWSVMVLLGGVVIGIAPATVTLVTVLRGQKDRKSTRLNSSHVAISYAVFCLKKKKATSLLS